LNFSEWQRPQQDSKEAAESVREREMPPWTYTQLCGEEIDPARRMLRVRVLLDLLQRLSQASARATRPI
jgi:hypothetical protein